VRVVAIGLAVLLDLASAAGARAAAKPGLAGAQELFQRNHWEEARSHVRSQWGSLPEKDRKAATFLVGRSYTREAEFLRAVHRFGAEVGLAYLEELGAVRANRNVAWVPLFTGLHQLELGRDAAAERTLLAAVGRAALPAEWKAVARLRRAVALHRRGRVAEAAPALRGTSHEARFLRLLLTGVAEPAPAPARDARERLLAAVVLFRAGRAAEAEALVNGLSLDRPDAEDSSDPNKRLRFHDPALVAAWERLAWERAAAALKPLAAGGTGAEKGLAAYYAGLSLFRVGAAAEAAGLLRQASASSLGPELQPAARLLIAASSWPDRVPPAAELLALWDATQGQPDAVLNWEELRRAEFARVEPFATKLTSRLREMLQSPPERPPGALVGRWGLARLSHGDDASFLGAALSEHRDKSNKNKLEWNDPLLLLALALADYRDQEYAQALETLFELAKTLPGLRALQWNLQGIYAARQKAGGEARIGQ
jgi:hypothetical protein